MCMHTHAQIQHARLKDGVTGPPFSYSSADHNVQNELENQRQAEFLKEWWDAYLNSFYYEVTSQHIFVLLRKQLQKQSPVGY